MSVKVMLTVNAGGGMAIPVEDMHFCPTSTIGLRALSVSELVLVGGSFVMFVPVDHSAGVDDPSEL